MSFAPTPTVETPKAGMLPMLLVALVVAVLLLGISTHLLALAIYG